MSLVITRISLSDFRSYESFEIEPDARLTLLVGPNAVGKTNLIEAVQLLTSTESFRKPQWGEVVRWGAERSRLSLSAEGDGRRLDIDLAVSETGRREYRVNQKLRRRLVDVAGVLPCVVFTPDDLRLVKDSAEKRRSALDSLGSQLSPAYASTKIDYERVVRQRNALLREETTSRQQLAVWTEQLITVGTRFSEARRRLFARLSDALVTAHQGMTPDGPLEPRYTPSWERDGVVGDREETAVSLEAHLKMKESEERARGTSLIGPHRDEITFLLQGRDARAYGSQGQQRTIALAWKLGEVMVITDVSGQPPILLLDDVMSELDESRRHALAHFVGTAAQTIVTTTNTGYFEEELLQRALVVRLEA